MSPSVVCKTTARSEQGGIEWEGLMITRKFTQQFKLLVELLIDDNDDDCRNEEKKVI